MVENLASTGTGADSATTLPGSIKLIMDEQNYDDYDNDNDNDNDDDDDGDKA